MNRVWGWARTAGWLSSTAAALVAQAPSETETAILREMEALLQTPVVVVSKRSQPLSEAPGVISVIQAEEIANRGYRSVAEALRDVPGLYAVNDLLTPNVGVRGINGGLRAYNRILKVMIDGQPVSFRPDATNFLGPELIPIEAVARIEVVRGPASALYGANAFLGVINVVTRDPAPESPSGFLVARHDLSGDRLGGGEGWFGFGTDRWTLLAAAQGYNLDRSGAELPPSSPLRLTRTGPGWVSQNDTALPRSFLLKGRLHLGTGRSLELLSQGSRLDSHAEFLDFGTLSHENRIQVNNGFARLKLDWALTDHAALSASAARAQGGPGSGEHLSSGSDSSYPKRDLDYRAMDWNLEARLDLRGKDTLTLGLDQSRDDEQLMNVYSVDKATGTPSALGALQGRKAFSTSGVYAQYAAQPAPGLGITLNLRRDQHDVYGSKTNYRIGVVRRFGSTLSAKLLYGTSYKAPAPWQLYAQPLYAGEVVGNDLLKPERASTWEAEVAWAPDIHFVVTLNGFHNRIQDKVELQPFGINQIPRNTNSQESWGGEGQARYLWYLNTLTLLLSYQRSEDRLRDPFLGNLAIPTSQYPALNGTFRWEFRFPAWGRLSVAERYVSPRRATPSNIQENLLRVYTLPAYALTEVAANLQRRWAGRRYRINLRVDNLLDRRYADPGFGGVDSPGSGRQVVLGLGIGMGD